MIVTSVLRIYVVAKSNSQLQTGFQCQAFALNLCVCVCVCRPARDSYIRPQYEQEIDLDQDIAHLQRENRIEW